MGDAYDIQSIKYFTADVSPRAGDEGTRERQQTYLRALRTIPHLSIHKGRFLPKVIRRPLDSDPNTFVDVRDTEEKGSDVNLATHLLIDAFESQYDAALVISQDTDLLYPMRMVSTKFKKLLLVGWSENDSPGKKHKAVASILRIRNSDSKASQFHDPVPGRAGALISKPTGW